MAIAQRLLYDLSVRPGEIKAGKKPQIARRALAYKWLRIIYRCWKDRVPYNEEKYIQRLKDTGSPLAKLIS